MRGETNIWVTGIRSHPRTWPINHPRAKQFEHGSPFFENPRYPNPGEAFAAEDVNDLRPLRGALSRVIDILLASAQSQLWGAGAPLFLKKGDNHRMIQTSTKTLFLFDRSHPLRQ